MQDVIHFLETQDEKRQRLRSSGDFIPGALCGNGAYYMHLHTTRDKQKVTCPECLKKLNIKG